MTRFAVAASLYLLIGFVQWFINVFIIERCIVDHFRSFMDLCSISNISVLCLTRPQFGYYIHGRSVHGHADTNMREMNEMLQRERDNLCSQRGLEPNTDDQCFIVCLPNDFREEFEKILAPLRNPNAAVNRMTGVDAVTAKTENLIQVYNSMNLFVASFLDKQLPGFASYAIHDRTFFESLLDIEFPDTSQTGIFYRDPSESVYNAAFLYGQEWTQLSFDCLLFCIVDLIFQDFLVAAIIAYVIVSGIRKFRELGGTKRLVKTSLVDDRFLI